LNSNKSFSSETSERYALALYELASENSELENIENNSKTFLNIYNSNSDLKIFIKNPTESISNQLITLNKISDSLNLSIIFKKFLSILVVKRRIFFLKNILTKFLSLSLKNRGEIKADLVSSKNLSNQELDNLNSELSKIIGSKVNFSYKVDESLIGGMSLQLGSLMIDTSVKNKLKKYEKVLLEV
tara:strand:- start:1352 stop:1909 length:558 start_codon:yes stop_codon:yes gene_type:complete